MMMKKCFAFLLALVLLTASATALANYGTGLTPEGRALIEANNGAASQGRGFVMGGIAEAALGKPQAVGVSGKSLSERIAAGTLTTEEKAFLKRFWDMLEEIDKAEMENWGWSGGWQLSTDKPFGGSAVELLHDIENVLKNLPAGERQAFMDDREDAFRNILEGWRAR